MDLIHLGTINKQECADAREAVKIQLSKIIQKSKQHVKYKMNRFLTGEKKKLAMHVDQTCLSNLKYESAPHACEICVF